MKINKNLAARKDMYDLPEQSLASDLDHRFELLSAYLDGEVTAAERQQVQHWLDTDPEFQALHARMLEVTKGIQNLPVPAPALSTQQLSERVFRRLERRQRLSRVILLGGGAIAALMVGAVTSLLGNKSNIPAIAYFGSEESPIVREEPLMIAINEPVVEIPKAPVGKKRN